MGISLNSKIRTAVEEAVDRLKKGELIILTDHEERENEGDLVGLADRIDPDQVDFMARYGGGLICASLGPEIVEKLDLRDQTPWNSSPFGTPFTESVDALLGNTTGISARERARTLNLLASPQACPGDFSRPGHIFPLRAHPRGIFGRTGHTEGACQLARLAGGPPAAVICEILGERGEMARGKELEEFAREHGLFLLSMEELISYCYTPLSKVAMPLPQGDFTLSLYPALPGESQGAMVLQSVKPREDWVPLRIHSQCQTGDLFGSRRCDCGEQLEMALELIGREGGLLIYLQQEGRGIGLEEKLRAYQLQEQGMDTVEANTALGHQADARDYQTAIRVLRSCGISQVQLLTNNPAKEEALTTGGFPVERRPLEAEPRRENHHYLRTKQEKMGHSLSLGVTNE